jgi:hypothetical protein
MKDQGVPSVRTARRRWSWATFWLVSILALGVCLVATLGTGNRSRAALALIGVLIVIGISAAFLDSVLLPIGEPEGSSQPSFAARGLGGAGFGGAAGGGFGGGGDCGGSGAGAGGSC